MAELKSGIILQDGEELVAEIEAELWASSANPIAKVKDSIDNLGENFINKIYTEDEIKYCESKKKQKYQHYAVRFAAKDFRLLCKQQEIPLRKPIRSFSTGMKAKLKVIIAVTHNAKLLVLDEPTAGLDVIARNEILDLLRYYLTEDEERTVLISSHISTDLEGFCDDVYLIDNGRLVFHEDTDTILNQYGVLKLSSAEYDAIEKEYLIASRKESYGYACLTKEKQYFLDNYPGIVVENGSLDSVIILMLGKEQFS